MIAYDELLAMFWSSHKPDRPSHGRQYMAAVFAEPGEQDSRARASAGLIAARLGRPLQTPVIAGARFYLAEDYHQKYYLRHHPLMIELIKYTPRQLVDSTLAAWLNGWIGTRQPEKAEAFLRTPDVSARAPR